MSEDRGAAIRGKRVVIFGLGQHGGGVAAVKWCVRHGAKEVVVYDQKPQGSLRTSLNQLQGLPVTLQCGNNDPRAIRAADFVIKNPAVPRETPLLKEARRIETDLSLLLTTITNSPPRQKQPLFIAVTGTKGKSSTVSAIGYGLTQAGAKHAVVGNIGVSIFSALDTLHQLEILVLELSSFQLGDLHFSHHFKRDTVTSLPAWPDVAICTNLYADHLNYYETMEKYVRDKTLIGACQQDEQWLLLNGTIDQLPYSEQIASQSKARLMLVSEDNGAEAKLRAAKTHNALTSRVDTWAHITTNTDSDPEQRELLVTLDTHNADRGPLSTVTPNSTQATAKYSLRSKALVGRRGYSLALAYASLHCINKAPRQKQVPALFETWQGVPHRMEVLSENARLCFINDTAATIPAATQAAIHTIQEQKGSGMIIYLIAGGSDKRLELDWFTDIAASVRKIFLLDGSATKRIVDLFKTTGQQYEGPFVSLAEAFKALLTAVDENERGGEAAETKIIALLSPGCASFGMFRHEFDRGEQWRALVQKWTQDRKV